jgi:hypothetical protein
MKTLPELLREADPLGYEPARRVQQRHIRRQAVLDASPTRDDARRRPMTVIALAAFAIIAIALLSFQRWSTAVDLVAAVRLEVRLAEATPTLGLREAVVAGTERKIYLHSEPVVSNSDIVQAQVVEGGGGWATFGVSITFGAEGARKMLRATESHIGQPLAILVDGEVVSAPVVRSPITTSALISGSYTRAEAERIVRGIVGR